MNRLLFALVTGAHLGMCLVAAAAPPAQNGPRIQFASTVYDFGKVQAGEVVKHSFVFTNTGNARLEISDVHPGCGCTTAGTWDKSIEPGKTGSIPLQFNSAGFGGGVSKSATVTCNDPANPQIALTLSGTVWKPIDVTPSMAFFNTRTDAEKGETKILHIKNNTGAPITITDLQCTNTQFEVALETVTPGEAFDVKVTSRPPFTVGTTVVPITAKTSYDKMPLLTMSAYLVVQPPVTVIPSQVVLVPGPLANATTNIVTVRNSGTNALQLSDVRVNVPGVQVRVNETQPGQIVQLIFALPAGFEIKPGESFQLTAKTSNPKLPLLTVPILQAGGFRSASVPQSVVPQSRQVLTRPATQPVK